MADARWTQNPENSDFTRSNPIKCHSLFSEGKFVSNLIFHRSTSSGQTKGESRTTVAQTTTLYRIPLIQNRSVNSMESKISALRRHKMQTCFQQLFR